jgi:hypothetical protein
MDEEPKREQETVDMQAEDAESMERLQREIRNLPVTEHLLYMMHSLSALAVDRLGLGGGDSTQRDLAQARVAIDAYKALVDVLERAKPDQVPAHRGVLSQLQMAYVAAVSPPATTEQ